MQQRLVADLSFPLHRSGRRGDALDELVDEARLADARSATQHDHVAAFDRDGDPANGEEYWVPWMRPDELLVPAVSGRLKAGLAGSNSYSSHCRSCAVESGPASAGIRSIRFDRAD